MKIEKFEYMGYIAELIYQPFFDDSTPRSRQYKLKIIKDNTVLIDRYNFTRDGAIAFFHRWVDNKKQ